MKVHTGHVGLNVTDLARAAEFYRQVFGLEVMQESREKGKEFIFLGNEGKLVITLWLQSRGHFDGHIPGLHHLSFEAESIEKVKAMEATLLSMNTPLRYDGVVPHREGSSSGGIYFEDPDGIRLEIYSPTGAEKLKMPEPEIVMSCGFF